MDFPPKEDFEGLGSYEAALRSYVNFAHDRGRARKLLLQMRSALAGWRGLHALMRDAVRRRRLRAASLCATASSTLRRLTLETGPRGCLP